MDLRMWSLTRAGHSAVISRKLKKGRNAARWARSEATLAWKISPGDVKRLSGVSDRSWAGPQEKDNDITSKEFLSD
jgi:hypothetical protein